MTPQEIGAIRDPLVRGREAQAWLRRAGAACAVVRGLRDDAIVEMRMAGHTQRDVAATLGMTAGRVAQIDAACGLRSTRVVEREAVG